MRCFIGQWWSNSLKPTISLSYNIFSMSLRSFKQQLPFLFPFFFFFFFLSPWINLFTLRRAEIGKKQRERGGIGGVIISSWWSWELPPRAGFPFFFFFIFSSLQFPSCTLSLPLSIISVSQVWRERERESRPAHISRAEAFPPIQLLPGRQWVTMNESVP